MNNQEHIIYTPVALHLGGAFPPSKPGPIVENPQAVPDLVQSLTNMIRWNKLSNRYDRLSMWTFIFTFFMVIGTVSAVSSIDKIGLYIWIAIDACLLLSVIFLHLAHKNYKAKIVKITEGHVRCRPNQIPELLKWIDHSHEIIRRLSFGSTLFLLPYLENNSSALMDEKQIKQLSILLKSKDRMRLSILTQVAAKLGDTRTAPALQKILSNTSLTDIHPFTIQALQIIEMNSASATVVR